MVEIVPVEVKIIAITVLDPYFSNGLGPDIKHSRALKYLILDVIPHTLQVSVTLIAV